MAQRLMIALHTKKVIRESADIFSINIWEKIIWWSMYRLVMRETNRRWFLQEECLMQIDVGSSWKGIRNSMENYEKETIAAIATALSDSGIGIVRISGENAIYIVDSIFRSASGKRF